jgi:hypothetical protein
MTLSKITWIDIFKIVAIFIIVFFAASKRLSHFGETGKDIYAYERAIVDLLEGKNPYTWTVESYSNPDDPGNHGFAYLPGLLYIFSPLYILYLKTGLPLEYLMKAPVLLADLGVGVLLTILLYKKNFLALLAALLIWFFNPYSYFKSGYTYADPLPIFFMFLALIYLEKDDVLAGTYYAVSVALKTFPYILFPVLLLKAKNKKDFLVAGSMVAFLVVLPFLRSPEFFKTFLDGSIFVHSNRFIQGRPFLFYISYFYKVELFQIIPFKVYTLLASFSGWAVVALLYFKKWVRDKFVLALIPFLTFYLFTPVLNRTYLIWFIPVYIMALFNLFSKKYRFLYYTFLVAYFAFYGWYLIQWKDGFHIWRP